MKLAVHYCYSNFIHHLSLLSYKCINEPESDDDKHRVEPEWQNLRLMCLQSPYYALCCTCRDSSVGKQSGEESVLDEVTAMSTSL